MDYYTEKETTIFRGRKTESQELMDKVFRSSVSRSFTTLLIGNSGVGKTSLIRAGLFPILIKMGWKCIWTRPLNPEPLKHILEDINDACETEGSGDIISSIKNLSDSCEPGILIAVDQFEDILRSQSHEREQVGKILRRIYSKSFRNVHVLLSYRGDYETEIFSFLENASITRPEKYSLCGFDKSVASDVLRNIFLDNSIGIDDVLLGRIMDELDKKSEIGRIYPPFIQIIAKCLIDQAKSRDYVITEEFYNHEVSVESIIGNYLINQLNEFGDANSEKRRDVEEILKELVRNRAKEQKNKSDLKRYLKIADSELQALLDLLVKKRLIRHLDDENYEIIYDFLASKVEEMINDGERPLRGARDILRTKAKHYKFIQTFLEPNEMAFLYSMKESIVPDIDEKELLIFSYLVGNGPVWWWFREDKSVYLTIIRKGLANRSSKVREAATVALERLGRKDLVKDSDLSKEGTVVGAFAKLSTHSNLVTIIGMLKDTDKNRRRTVFEVFDRLVIHSDFPIIINLLNEANPYLRKVVTEALKKLVPRDKIINIAYMRIDYNENTKDEVDAVYAIYKKLAAYNDFDTIMDMINSQDITVRKSALALFEKLVTHDDLTPIIYMIFKFKNLNYFNDEYFIEVLLNEMEDMKNKSKKLDSKDNSRLIDLEELFNRRYNMILRERDNTLKDFDFLDNSRIIMDEDFSKKKYQRIFSVSERENASKEFQKFVTHDDLPKIIDILKSGYYMRNRSGHVSYAAFFAFEKLVTHEDLPKIIAMLRVRSWYARRAAIKTFEKLVTHDDLITIINIIRDPEPDIRDVAVKAFEKLVTHDDLTVVIDMLRSPEPNIRDAAVGVFEKLATYDDLRATIDLLKDSSLDVRNEASKTIIKFGNENDLLEIVKKFANGEITNTESHKCIVALDEKFYSPFGNIL